jgi:hypothetical protein
MRERVKAALTGGFLHSFTADPVECGFIRVIGDPSTCTLLEAYIKYGVSFLCEVKRTTVTRTEESVCLVKANDC